jgi:hypothetical protein
VRRFIAIALFFLVSFPLISPLLALTGSFQANLPACCRRNGAHHCTASMQMPGSADAPIKLAPRPERCPAFPQFSNSIPHIQLAAPTAALLFAEVVSHPAVRPQTQASARVSLDRARQKRGPPVILL